VREHVISFFSLLQKIPKQKTLKRRNIEMNDQVTKQGQRKTNLRLVGAPVLVNTPKADNA
jgi:hypothetical protein